MKYIKLSGNLYLTGNNGINRVEPLGEHDPKRKGSNRTIVHGPNFSAVVEETVEQISELLNAESAPFPRTGIQLDCGCIKVTGLNGTQEYCKECLPF